MRKPSFFGWYLLALIAIVAFLIIWNTCDRRTEENVTVTKKQGKTTVISQSQTKAIDSLLNVISIISNTKPKVVTRWLRPELTHDTTERQPNLAYTACDSVIIQSDTGTFKGVRYAINDTILDNKIAGRSIKFDVTQLTIKESIVNTVETLRVDTVFINTKEKKRRFGVVVGAGYGYSPVSPLPTPHIGLTVGFRIF